MTVYVLEERVAYENAGGPLGVFYKLTDAIRTACEYDSEEFGYALTDKTCLKFTREPPFTFWEAQSNGEHATEYYCITEFEVQ